LREADIEAVVIDISKGRDIDPPRISQASKPELRRAGSVSPALPRRRFVPPSAPAHFDLASTAPQSTAREFGHAAKVAERSHKVVNKVFLQARLGKTIKAGLVEPVIEDIFASIQRNPHALNGLLRCKQNREYLYRHALACSALMISLGRELKLSAGELREAGMAGLLFDVGINHLPVDHDALGGDHRKLPLEVFASHVRLGHDFLLASGLPPAVAIAALHHHERVDGAGYPEKRMGGDIPMLCRMAAVCDAYDELASAADGSQAVDPAAVLAAMATMPGKFDPAIFAAFVRCMGSFPIGTIVDLKSGRLAMVIDQCSHDFAKPTVRTFFSLVKGERIRSENIDLANCFGQDEIVGLADLSRFEPEDVLELRQRMMLSVAKAKS
jgi:HD-GYP domain-containing protein (c-di-GMP phosphodiesterase class II)